MSFSHLWHHQQQWLKITRTRCLVHTVYGFFFFYCFSITMRDFLVPDKSRAAYYSTLRSAAPEFQLFAWLNLRERAKKNKNITIIIITFADVINCQYRYCPFAILWRCKYFTVVSLVYTTYDRVAYIHRTFVGITIILSRTLWPLWSANVRVIFLHTTHTHTHTHASARARITYTYDSKKERTNDRAAGVMRFVCFGDVVGDKRRHRRRDVNVPPQRITPYAFRIQKQQ